MNPVIPTMWDVLMTLVVAVVIAVTIAALVVWNKKLSSREVGALSLIAILLLPGVGAIAFLLVHSSGRKREIQH